MKLSILYFSYFNITPYFRVHFDVNALVLLLEKEFEFMAISTQW